MSKVIICNNEKIYTELCGDYESQGFNGNGAYCNSGIYIKTYSKKNVKTVNYYENDYGFVACAGTIIYRGATGESCLKRIYDDFSFDKINMLRREMSGSYVVVVYKAGQVSIFIDESGTYAFHYYYQKGVFVATNTYYHIQKIVRSKFDRLAFQERIVEFCNIDDATPFENIKRLLGDEAIELNTDSQNNIVKSIGNNIYEFDIKNEEEILNNMVKLISKYTKRYLSLGNRKILFTTGGVDSRLVLSVYNYLGEKPIIANWQGCPFEMNTKIPDEVISREIAIKQNLEFLLFDVSHNYEEDCERIDELFEKYGEYGLIYSGNRKWYHIFEDNEFDIIDFGYFGETIKGWEPLDAVYHKGFCIDDFIKLYCLRQTYNHFHNDDLIYYVKEKIIKIAKDNNLDISNLSKNDCMFLYYKYRAHADTVCSNFANIFSYSTNIFAEKEIVDFINQIPYELKENDHLNLRLTERLESQLLEVDYFTHCQYRVFDRNEMMLKQKNSVILALRKLLNRYRIGKVIISLKHALSHNTDNQKRIAVEQVSKTRFVDITDMKIDKTAFSYDVMLYEMPGWAKFIQTLI